MTITEIEILIEEIREKMILSENTDSLISKYNSLIILYNNKALELNYPYQLTQLENYII